RRCARGRRGGPDPRRADIEAACAPRGAAPSRSGCLRCLPRGVSFLVVLQTKNAARPLLDGPRRLSLCATLDLTAYARAPARPVGAVMVSVMAVERMQQVHGVKASGTGGEKSRNDRGVGSSRRSRPVRGALSGRRRWGGALARALRHVDAAG